MRLVNYRTAAAGYRLGAVTRDGQVVDLSAVAPDLLSLIDQGPGALARAAAIIERGEAIAPLAEVELGMPLVPRGNVLCVGLNYHKHAEEGARLRGGEVKPPTVFTKAVTSLVGPYDDIVADGSISPKLDWEVELGVVIGRAGANIKAAAALEHVFGYTVVNDVSARDLQHGWGGQWFKGKSVDATSPVGPWVVTRDEVPDPSALDLELRVNGVAKQSASTREMIHPVPELIEWMSFGMTLLAGCLIATGTPEGVGNARTPPEFLAPGDVMETEVGGVGVLKNRIVSAASPPESKKGERA